MLYQLSHCPTGPSQTSGPVAGYQPPRPGGLGVPARRPASAGLLVGHVAAAPAAVLLELDALAGVDLGLGRDVVAPLALLALQGDGHSLVGRHVVGLALGFGGGFSVLESVATDRFELSTSRL